MAIAYPNATKNARMNAITTLLGSAGTLTIGTSSLSGATGVLASVPLANPAAPAASGAGVLTFSVPRTVTASATGTAAKAELRDSGGTVVATLTVGTSGTDIIVGSTSFTTGQDVNLTSGVITHG